MPFVFTYVARRRRVLALFQVPVCLALYAAKVASARWTKERIMKACFKGVRKACIARHADWFCDCWLPARFNRATLDRLSYHKQAGHRVVLLSASPDLYVPEIAKRLDIGEVICTNVEFDSEKCTGRIVGSNCAGAEKLARLKRVTGSDVPPAGSYAYGDRASDYPVLAWVDNGWMVEREKLIPFPQDRS